jgi:hypothetical protein
MNVVYDCTIAPYITLYFIPRDHYLFTYLHTYLLTYLLTQWCRVLLEKLTGSQLVKKFPPRDSLRTQNCVHNSI